MILGYLDTKNPKETLKKIIIFFYIYMIIEGMLRKWFLPFLNKEIYFLKDFFLIFIYLYAYKYNFLLKRKISKFLLFLIITSLIFGSIGYSFNKLDILSFILGSRSYWLFAPLFLIIIHVCSFEDAKKFVRINLYFIFPYYILVILQSYFPVDTFINSGYNSIVQTPDRPSAYFTYITQNTYYFLFLLSCFYSHSLTQKFINKKKFIFLIILNFLLMGVMILLKSRACYVFGVAIIIYSLYITLVTREELNLKIKKLLIILIITPVSFGINSSLFEDQYKKSVKRINTDTWQKTALITNSPSIQLDFPNINLFNLNMLEIKSIRINLRDFCSRNSSVCRVINEFYYITSINNTSKFGEGIGAGNSVVTYLKKDKRFVLGEAENHRILGELGYLYGNMFILLKYLIVIYLNLIFLFTGRVRNKLFYFPLLVFVSVSFLIGPITYTTSFISFICWFSLGLLISSFNKHDNKSY